MADKVIDGRQFDFSPNHREKLVVAWACMAVSFAIWALYSTPNTIDFVVSMTKGVKVIGIANGGVFVGIVLGLGLISIGEYIFMYLMIWKNILFAIPLLICMGISIMASTGYEYKAIINTNIKNEKIADHSSLVENKQMAIQDTRKLVYEYDARIESDRNQGTRSPDWVYARRRQANELLQQQTQELERLTHQKISVKDELGPIFNTKNWSSGSVSFWTIFLAVFAEVALVGLGIVAVGLRKSNTDEKSKLRLINGDYNPAYGGGYDDEMVMVPASVARQHGLSGGSFKSKKKKSRFGFQVDKNFINIDDESENESESESENSLENFHFSDDKKLIKLSPGMKAKAKKNVKAKGDHHRQLVSQIYGNGVTTSAGISRVLKTDYRVKITPQRVSQIKREIGLS